MPEAVIAGRYRLGDLLGRGGMSEVWSATDAELGRRVALKLLAPHADTGRFEREARAVASLAHPNVTQLYDYGSAEGRPFMVLEYLPGGTLEDRLRPGAPLSDSETERVAREIAAGLAHAHERGVEHRDLKPANVLFDEEGRAKLADFGIARLTTGEGTLTEAGTVLGTAAYISPEQAGGAPATAASDVYSFGVMLYRMLAGRLPFESSDPMELVRLHRDDEPPPLRRFRGDAPARLEATAAVALAKDPAARPRDGSALLAHLGAAAGVDLTAATAVLPRPDAVTRVLPAGGRPHAPRAGGPPPPPRNHLALALAALLVLAVAGAAVAYALTRPSRSGTTTSTVRLPSVPASRPSLTSTPSTTAPTTAAQTTQRTTAPAPTTRQTTAPTTAPSPPLPLPTTTLPLSTPTTVPTILPTTTP
jgi:serine/threonine-protein kinase